MSEVDLNRLRRPGREKKTLKKTVRLTVADAKLIEEENLSIQAIFDEAFRQVMAMLDEDSDSPR